MCGVWWVRSDNDTQRDTDKQTNAQKVWGVNYFKPHNRTA